LFTNVEINLDALAVQLLEQFLFICIYPDCVHIM